MECLAEMIGSLLAESCKTLITCTITRIQTTINFHSNSKTLETEIQKLTELKNSIDENVDLARREGKSPTAKVNKWLRDVSEIEREVGSILEVTVADRLDACDLCCNLCCRYQNSKETIEKIKEVKRLINSCNFQLISPEKRSPFRAVQRMSVPSLAGQPPAMEKLERLMKLLKDDKTNRIGVYGMGGVGKTTLLMNLINNFECSLIEYFDIVIWVTVSRDLDYHEVQSAIAERLNLEFDCEESMQRRANRLHSRLMMKKKSLLILDNVWEEVNLGCVGIPQGDDRERCKIIMATRSLEVCRKMVTDEDIKVEVLGEEAAWDLFAQFAGDVVKSKDIETHARDICRRCYGLPLLIKAMGTSMRNKHMIELWKDKRSSLINPTPNFRGLEKEVFETLKLSYDTLSENHQSCFLYCCLYPANFSITTNELIECWMADGLVGRLQSLEESFNRGIALVESLRDSCMFEQGDSIGTVKMHDLWREFAARLNSEEKEHGFICQHGISSSELEEKIARSKHYIRTISLMHSDAKMLPAWLQKCVRLSVLFLQGNPLEKIPDNFFQDLKVIRYLNLSNTSISSLPPSLLQLRELHTLLLRGCRNLERLPSLGALCKLEILDISDTPVQKLSKDMGKQLKKLNLFRTYNLEHIEAGTLSGMPSLEYLDTSFSAYKWDVEQHLGEKRSAFYELLSLKRLSALRIRLDNFNYLAKEDWDWIRRLQTFRIWVGPIICEPYDSLWESDVKRATFRRVDLNLVALERGVEQLLCSVSSLDLIKCGGFSELADIFHRENLHGLQNLRSLTLSGSSWIKTIFCGEMMRRSVLPNLEHLTLDRLENLAMILDGILPKGCLCKLKIIEVANCPKLRKLISYAFLRRLQNLERISVSGCETMRYIISAEIPSEELPDLTLLELRDLKCLTGICPGKSDWPARERIKVSNCPKLLRHPSSFNKRCPPKETSGNFETQNSSEGLHEDAKANLRKDFEFP